MTREEMYNLMRKELEETCVDCSDVKAGFIGEVGSTWPIEGMQSYVNLNKLPNILRNYYYNYSWIIIFILLN